VPVDDPDPFGVLALEEAGLAIKEAGTKTRPSSDAFEYRPSPTSPLFGAYARRSLQSIDRFYPTARGDGRRDSRRSVMSDHGTQTPSPIDGHPRALSPKPTAVERPWIISEDGEDHVEQADGGAEPAMHPMVDGGMQTAAVAEPVEPSRCTADDDHDEPEAIIGQGEPVQVFGRTAAMRHMGSRVKLVTIPKRLPPALPARSPFRSRATVSVGSERAASSPDPAYDSSSQYTTSPTRSAFDKSSVDSPNPWSRQTSINDVDSRSSWDESANEKDAGACQTPPDDRPTHVSDRLQDGPSDDVNDRDMSPRAESPVSLTENPTPTESTPPQADVPTGRLATAEATEAEAGLIKTASGESITVDIDADGHGITDHDIFHSIPTTPLEHGHSDWEVRAY
jgi:hypothetical protein